MPIKVQCVCGAAFAAKDELAGRTVKCPKCQQPLDIPAAGAATAVAAPGAAPRFSAPLPSQGAPAGQPAGDFFAEAGLVAQQAGMAPCPGCAQAMPVNAVVCIKCGYNKKIGRRMDVVKQTGGPLLPGGHSVTAEELLNKAAMVIEDEKEEERKKVREGMPWWVYLIIMGCLLGFMIGMILLPKHVAMTAAPFIIYGVAGVINLYAVIRVVMIAFAEGVGHGVGCLICGLYFLVYCIMRWDRCGGYFVIFWVTNVIAGVAGMGMQFMMEGEEDARRKSGPPAAVVISHNHAWQSPPLQRPTSA